MGPYCPILMLAMSNVFMDLRVVRASEVPAAPLMAVISDQLGDRGFFEYTLAVRPTDRASGLFRPPSFKNHFRR